MPSSNTCDSLQCEVSQFLVTVRGVPVDPNNFNLGKVLAFLRDGQVIDAESVLYMIQCKLSLRVLQVELISAVDLLSLMDERGVSDPCQRLRFAEVAKRLIIRIPYGVRYNEPWDLPPFVKAYRQAKELAQSFSRN